MAVKLQATSIMMLINGGEVQNGYQLQAPYFGSNKKFVKFRLGALHSSIGFINLLNIFTKITIMFSQFITIVKS